MNAIDFLIKEHNRVRKVLSDISDEPHRYETKRKMFESLGEDLIRHEAMEHKVWYPYFQNDQNLNEEVRHLIREENFAERAIKRLAEIKTESAWEEHFVHLKENIEHHAKEEENKLFPEVKKLLTAENLEKIGSKMYNFKKNYSRPH